jgi:hypothetical protein
LPSPELYKALEERDVKYATHLPANDIYSGTLQSY